MIEYTVPKVFPSSDTQLIYLQLWPSVNVGKAISSADRTFSGKISNNVYPVKSVKF